MTTTHQYIEQAITELIREEPDRARAIGLLTLARLSTTGIPIVEPSEPQMTPDDPGFFDLPPMQPLKRFKATSLNTKVKTLDVTCPTCKAKPGKRCVRMSSRGPNAQPTDIPLVMGDGKSSNHKRRTDKARQASS